MNQIILGALFIIITIVAGWLILFYNRIIGKKAEVEDKWEITYLRLSHLQLKDNVDLILNYTQTVIMCDSKDKEIIDSIVKLQYIFIHTKTIERAMKSSLGITDAVEKLLQKINKQQIDNTDEKFIQLYSKLNELNEKVQEYYKLYDDKVIEYNLYLKSFPNNFAVKILGFKPLTCFSWLQSHTQEDMTIKSEV